MHAVRFDQKGSISCTCHGVGFLIIPVSYSPMTSSVLERWELVEEDVLGEHEPLPHKRTIFPVLAHCPTLQFVFENRLQLMALCLSFGHFRRGTINRAHTPDDSNTNVSEWYIIETCLTHVEADSN